MASGNTGTEAYSPVFYWGQLSVHRWPGNFRSPLGRPPSPASEAGQPLLQRVAAAPVTL